MKLEPNFPTKYPYPERFWKDGFGCHWCHRETDNMVSGHDGMCPVPHLADAEARVAELERDHSNLRKMVGQGFDDTLKDIEAEFQRLVRYVRAERKHRVKTISTYRVVEGQKEVIEAYQTLSPETRRRIEDAE